MRLSKRTLRLISLLTAFMLFMAPVMNVYAAETKEAVQADSTETTEAEITETEAAPEDGAENPVPPAQDSTVTEVTVPEEASSEEAAAPEESEAPAEEETEESSEEDLGGLLEEEASDPKLEDGIYTIRSAISDTMVMDINGASASNGAQLQLYEFNDTQAQQFFVKSLGSGLYSMESACSGKMIDVNGAKTADGTKIQQYESNGTKAQKWYIQTTSKSGYYKILSAIDKTKALDVTDGKSANKTKVQLYKASDSERQQWRFQLRNPIAAPENGTYTIHSAMNSGMVLDVNGAKKTNGTNVQLYESNGTNAQKFSFRAVGDGFYEILNINSGLALDVKGASRTNGANVQQYEANGTKAQRWRFFQAANGTYVIYSGIGGRVLEVKGGGTANKTNVQSALYERKNSQRFTLTKLSDTVITAGATPAATPTPTPTATPTPDPVSTVDLSKLKAVKPENGSIYKVQAAVGSSMVLDVNGSKDDNKTNVQIYSSNDTNAQRWYMVKSGDWYVLKCVATAKVLDVDGAKTADGTNVWQYESNGTKAQHWKFYDTGDGDGSVYIVSELGKFLTVKNGASANKTNIEISTGKTEKAQKFYLKKASAANGWVKNDDGKKSYYSGGKKVTGWQTIDSQTYYFNSSGVMVTSTYVDNYKINADGHRSPVKITTRSRSVTTSKTVLGLLKNAMVPMGRVLCVWGGGHSDGTIAGYNSGWDDFWADHGTKSYNRHNYEYAKNSGLDCSGYVAWSVYNTLYSKSGQKFVAYATAQMQSFYLKEGWVEEDMVRYDNGSATRLPAELYPGDVCVMSGHVMLCLGKCADGSYLFAHSGSSTGDGGGVQLSGTARPYMKNGQRYWDSNSVAYKLAQKYMAKYFPEWPFGVRPAMGATYLNFAKGRLHWKTSGGVLTDPEGVQNMSAEEVMKLLLGPV